MEKTAVNKKRASSSKGTIGSGAGTIFPSVLLSGILLLPYTSGTGMESPILSPEIIITLIPASVNLLLLFRYGKKKKVQIALWKYILFPILSITLSVLLCILGIVVLLSSQSGGGNVSA